MLLDEICEFSLQRLLARIGQASVAQLARLFSPLIRRRRGRNVPFVEMFELVVGTRTHSYTLANVSLLTYRHPV